MWCEIGLQVSNLARNVPFMATPLTPEAVAIGQAVRGAIAQAGMTQAETAMKSGMALNTLSRRINGILPFTWPELVAISAVTGVTCSELAANAERIAARTAEATG